MRFEISTTPSSTNIQFLGDKINQESVEYGDAYNFGLFVYDEHNTIIGGANGSVIFGGIYTDQLWVENKFRGKGFGRQIMERVHDFGRENGCKMASVTTMSFQNAKGFYEKLGYRVDFERNGYVMGSSMIFLSKTL